MSFVSLNFLIFFVAFLVLYFTIPRVWFQNYITLIGSYIFYGWWDLRFLLLVFSVSAASFLSALFMERAPSRGAKKAALIVTCVFCLGMLGVFKYLGFFVESAEAILQALGFQHSFLSLKILLPVGISFFTFQALAYVVDVYRGDAAVERDPIRFLAFIAFFPQLVAGPIERAHHLLSQFHGLRRFDPSRLTEALWLIVYGYFLKMVLADGIAPIVDKAFDPGQLFGWSTIFGTLGFTIQIYGDFMGYSLIAKGAALLLGIELVWNFNLPYWSRNISDFWRRWHTSLSFWLRDYLYIPLGGSRSGSLATYRNLLITMGLGGLWHGANWTFIAWGLWHGGLLVLWHTALQNYWERMPPVLAWFLTMLFVVVSWFFFRVSDVAEMATMLQALGNLEWLPNHALSLQSLAIGFGLLYLLEWPQFANNDRLWWARRPLWQFLPVTALMIVCVLAMTKSVRTTFIYFQF